MRSTPPGGNRTFFGGGGGGGDDKRNGREEQKNPPSKLGFIRSWRASRSPVARTRPELPSGVPPLPPGAVGVPALRDEPPAHMVGVPPAPDVLRPEPPASPQPLAPSNTNQTIRFAAPPASGLEKLVRDFRSLILGCLKYRDLHGLGTTSKGMKETLALLPDFRTSYVAKRADYTTVLDQVAPKVNGVQQAWLTPIITGDGRAWLLAKIDREVEEIFADPAGQERAREFDRFFESPLGRELHVYLPKGYEELRVIEIKLQSGQPLTKDDLRLIGTLEDTSGDPKLLIRFLSHLMAGYRERAAARIIVDARNSERLLSFPKIPPESLEKLKTINREEGAVLARLAKLKGGAEAMGHAIRREEENGSYFQFSARTQLGGPLHAVLRLADEFGYETDLTVLRKKCLDWRRLSDGANWKDIDFEAVGFAMKFTLKLPESQLDDMTKAVRERHGDATQTSDQMDECFRKLLVKIEAAIATSVVNGIGEIPGPAEES
jgi:hypothetical protein